jgi:hypothetical protein
MPKGYIHCFCWRSGLAEFGKAVPAGARVIALNLTAEEREKLEPKFRLGQSNDLLVPGVPEAASDRDAGIALRLFIKWAIERRCLTKREYVLARRLQERALKAAGLQVARRAA